MMPKANIGTRGSDLALYQANLLKGKLELKGLDGQIVTISTTGDRNQDRNLQNLGTGIFTKALDEALSNGDIDLAVHSMKDVPTILQEDIEVFAVLERGECGDVLVVNNLERNVVATGSIRRRAQWLRRYPQDEVHGLRGNVQTRIDKVKRNEWKGGIFAKAGLARLNKAFELNQAIELDWMIPAPAQGAIVVLGRSVDLELKAIVSQLNHQESSLAVAIERSFLNRLEGGCSAPIGARAIVQGQHVDFVGCLTSPNGEKEVRIARKSSDASPQLGREWAELLLENGGREIMKLFHQ